MQAPTAARPSARARTLSRLGAPLLAVLLGLVLAAYVATLAAQAPHPGRSDFYKFYASTRLLWEGRSIYAPVPAPPVDSSTEPPADEYLHANLNPPFQTVLLAPLGLLPYPSAFAVWASLTLLAGCAAVWIIARQLGYGRPGHFLACLVVFLLSYGTFLNAASGQFGTVVLLAVVLGWRSTLRGHDALAGLAVGVALGLKVFLAVLLLVWLVQRRWRALAWAAVAALACAGIGWAGAGLDAYREYLRVLAGVEWIVDGRNASLIGVAERLGQEAAGEAGPSPLWALAGRAAALAVIAATARVAWRAEPSARSAAAGLVAAVPAMLLASPLGWVYYFPALMLPVVWLWRMAGDAGRPRWRAALVAAWLLVAAPAVTKGSPLTVSALPFLGLCALWAGSLAAVCRQALVPPEEVRATHNRP